MPEATGLKKMSLRRALWQARIDVDAAHPAVFRSATSDHATHRCTEDGHTFIHDRESGCGICDVYRVKDAHELDVLKSDPDIFYASTFRELAAMLRKPEPVKVLASRSAVAGLGPELDQLRDLCRSNSDDSDFKTVFVDYV